MKHVQGKDQKFVSLKRQDPRLVRKNARRNDFDFGYEGVCGREY